MKQLLFFLLLLPVQLLQAKQPAPMDTARIEAICTILESRFQSGISKKTNDEILLKLRRNPADTGMYSRAAFPIYLHNAYYRDSVAIPRVTTMKVEEGTLLRIGEGKLGIEWIGDLKLSRGEPYYCPTEMTETVYYFLNGTLVKISIRQGHADYNAIPANWWVVLPAVDIFYNGRQQLGISYLCLHPSISGGWGEELLKDMAALFERAFPLLSAYQSVYLLKAAQQANAK